MKKIWENDVPTWVWALIVVGACLDASLWATYYEIFDTKLGITLVIVEIPIALIAGFIISTILNESRKHAKEIGEEVGKQIEKIPVVNITQTENQKHIDDHCETLIERYKNIAGRALMSGILTELELYDNLQDKEQLLQHFYTGHEELFLFLQQTINVEKQMKLIQKPISSENKPRWTEIINQRNSVQQKYGEKMKEFLGQIDRKSIQLGGICNECKKWHDPESVDFKKLETKLQSFIMPF